MCVTARRLTSRTDQLRFVTKVRARVGTESWSEHRHNELETPVVERDRPGNGNTQ